MKALYKSYVTSIHWMSCIQRTQNSELRGLFNIILKDCNNIFCVEIVFIVENTKEKVSR